MVTLPGPMVTLEEKRYPDLAALRVSLDGAQLREKPPPRPTPTVGKIEPSLRIAHFEISGQPILIEGAKVELSCVAHDVQLGRSRDQEGNVLLLLQDAAEGSLEIAVALADLEALILAAAKRAVGKQGVTLESVRIELRSHSDRVLDLVILVRARKLFLGAVVRISGRMTIDDQLKARFSGLECVGEGALGTLAGGFIAPYLKRFDGREFSLMALPLGGVKLRDLRVATGNELRVTAEFGDAISPA